MIAETDEISVTKLRKGSRPMVSKKGRLYRADDRLFIRDRESSDAYLIYNIDQTQPILPREEFLDTNITRAYIDSSKIAGNKKTSWMNLDSGKLWKYLTVIAVVGSLIYGFMMVQ